LGETRDSPQVTLHLAGAEGSDGTFTNSDMQICTETFRLSHPGPVYPTLTPLTGSAIVLASFLDLVHSVFAREILPGKLS
jgi:hypothetical protein